MFFDNLITGANNLVWSLPLVGLLLLTGLYFSLRTIFLQVRCIPDMLSQLRKGESSPDGTSSFQSLMLSLAGRVGMGNIGGVATAIALGGPGVGALGMCFTGGFALAMMVDDAVAAPVLAQPSTPFAITPARSRDLNLSDADLAKVKERAASGCDVLGLRFVGDRAVGKRFERLTEEIGDAFIRVELPGKGHSTVTEHRSQVAVDAVLEFFADKLKG